MAQGVLFNVAEGIIGNLGPLAFKEIKLLCGVKDELEKLKDTVSLINDVLLDVEEQQVESRAVRNWLKELEDVMYEADDLLDDFSTEALRREVMTGDKMAKEVRMLFSKSNQLLYAHKMGHNIKAIRKRLYTVNGTARDFHLKVHNKETPVRNKKRDNTHSFVRAKEVIGREDDKKEVMKRLMDCNVKENVLILPIVGVSGLGKTALAQLIFNDEKIEKHFQLKMWVCASENFDVKIIVEKILGSATNSDMNILVNNLRKKIDGKKYLLVLDDVWNEDHEKWFAFKALLMGGVKGSRILVTTCSKKVAKITHTIKPYLLRGLNEMASWSLFKQMAFEKGQDWENPSMVAIGREIVRKCVGVPLAIRTVGSLLYLKSSEREWLSFKNKELSKISQKENVIFPTLKLSYDQLPSHLKHCFAYCSLFPKDYMIDRSTLIKLWIAQGFVKSLDQNRCLEDVANEYFMELLCRSFFQEAQMDDFDNVIGCKMHDLMHDLAILVAGSMTTTLDAKTRNIDENTRHVSFAGDCDAIFSSSTTSLYKASRIRTFLCHQGFSAKIDCDAFFSSFKLLRVLDLRNLHFVPSSIGKLKHLRYLDLSGNKVIKKLPDSITRLQNLQTLKLSDCESPKELPRGIKRLVNLKHLEIDGCNSLTYMPRGLGNLTNLQTLSKFVVDSGYHSGHSSDLQELNRLNNLRGKLEIENLGHGKGVASECLAANLKEKQHLHALSLRWSEEGSVNDSDVTNDEASLECFQPHPNLKELFLEGYRGSCLPSWLSSLTNLVTFTLRSCEKCQNLPSDTQLPSLKYLYMYHCHRLKSLPPGIFTALQHLALIGSLEFEVANDEDGMQWQGLTSLLSLCFFRLPKLVSLPSGLQHATTLQTLKISDCQSLKAIPDWIHNCKSLQVLEIRKCLSLASPPEGMPSLTSLQRLTIVDCPILLRRCERYTGEDWPKIAHIPKLDIR